MGQSQSSWAHAPRSTTYHPSAVEHRSLRGTRELDEESKQQQRQQQSPTSSAAYRAARQAAIAGTAADFAPDVRRSLIGPMRSRVKKKPPPFFSSSREDVSQSLRGLSSTSRLLVQDEAMCAIAGSPEIGRERMSDTDASRRGSLAMLNEPSSAAATARTAAAATTRTTTTTTTAATITGEVSRSSTKGDISPLAYIGLQPLHSPNAASSSSFTSLAPPPTPAPVPPPRRHRRRSRQMDASGSHYAPSASPASPATPSFEDGSIRPIGRASPLFIDDDGTPPVPLSGHHTPLLVQIGASLETAPSQVVADGVVPRPARPSSSSVNTEARESLLSDDLDYVEAASRHSPSLRPDELDSDANMQLYRTSLVDARRARSGTIGPHSHVNLSPVREIMTPESRVMSGDERPGALSAASTLQNTHRRINSGASMGMVALSPAFGEAPSARRPLPAPSVVAEPRTDKASVHRANSISSSYGGTSTVGGPNSISSWKKHTAQPIDAPDVHAAAAAAAVTLAHRRRMLKDETGADMRARASSMPSEPRSPLAEAVETIVARSPVSSMQSPPPLIDRLSLNPARLSAQRDSRIRESWRSTDGPWDARVVTMADAVAMPPAKGVLKPMMMTNMRHLRSNSAPMSTLLDSTVEADMTESSMHVAPPDASEDAHDDDDAAPFAETAVQASLAALQALEQSEEVRADGNDWHARWASVKLLGFSSPGVGLTSLRRRLPHDGSTTLPAEDLSDYSGARIRRRADPYPRLRAEGSTSSFDLKESRRRRRAKRQEAMSSSASQIGGGGGYDGSVGRGGGEEAGALSESDRAPLHLTPSRHRRRRQRHHRQEKQSPSVQQQDSRSAAASLGTKVPSAALPLSATDPRRSISTVEWDEMIVPAHAKRLEQEAVEEARLMQAHVAPPSNAAFAPSGLVAPGSPLSADLPSPAPADQAADVSMGSMLDYGEAADRKTQRYLARAHKSPSKRRIPLAADAVASIEEDARKPSRRHRLGGDSQHPTVAGGAAGISKHGKYPTSSTASLTKSTRSATSRKGYGCDDIVAWQANLHIAALPAVAET